MVAPPTVKLENIKVVFGSESHPVHALDAVNLEFFEGDRVLVVGRNGSGKSTLLRVMAGLVPFSGNVIAGGVRTHRDAWYKEAREHSLFVPQDIGDAVGGNVTVGEFRRILGRGRHKLQDAESEWIDSHSGLLISQLSGGQRQFVITLASLLRTRQIYLFDEVFRGLDETMRERFCDLLASELEPNSTALFVSHEPRYLDRVVNRFLRLDAGHLCEDRKFVVSSASDLVGDHA